MPVLATDLSGPESVSLSETCCFCLLLLLLCQYHLAAREQRLCVCHSLAQNCSVRFTSSYCLSFCAMSRPDLAEMTATDSGFESAMPDWLLQNSSRQG